MAILLLSLKLCLSVKASKNLPCPVSVEIMIRILWKKAVLLNLKLREIWLFYMRDKFRFAVSRDNVDWKKLELTPFYNI